MSDSKEKMLKEWAEDDGITLEDMFFKCEQEGWTGVHCGNKRVS